MYSPYTDLAMEARELFQKSLGERRDPPGVRVEEETVGDVEICRVHVENAEGEKALGKPIGQYITLTVKALKERDADEELKAARILANELEKLLPARGRQDVALVVGLGNEQMTPDALGPRTVEQVMITRHILEAMPNQVDPRVRPVSALAPGVLGTTGIETMEVIKGVVDRLKPACVLAIDALASLNVDRMGTTVQISNTGISPGSGLGRKKMALSAEYLGVPFLALGVPTVVYAATIAREAMESALGGQNADNALTKWLGEGAQGLDQLVVTPKEIDTLIDDAARVVSMGINLALHPGVTVEEVQGFLH